MGQPDPALLLQAASCLPECDFLLTSAFEDRKNAARVRFVIKCGDDPLMVLVAMPKGHAVEPLIQGSKAFALNLLRPEDRLLTRKFPVDPDNQPLAPDEDDPLECVPLTRLQTGAPVLPRSPLVLDCEVARHFDLELDYGVYVGHVVGASLDPSSRVLRSPAVKQVGLQSAGVG